MSDTQQPNHVFILMGVSGSGKSAVANGVAHKLDAAFLDGDFLHPRANIKKMAEGHALNDDDRQPWLEALNDAIFAMQRTNNISLLVCSALKKRYRDILRNGNKNLSFLYMQGDFELIESRLKTRKGHFFKPQMLISQFEALEEPTSDEKDIHAIDIKPALDEVIKNTIKTIHHITKRH
ncbi:gluconokinase [Xenorhabdus cabanillasii]|uniref:Gluconokinase n=1 Tax=Xenorhabdus cabanillasii JM26 TaxID=1427517 RepID=W1IP06_9GAMM|nr:gluconokinase [Xenorhabdus cabanillasii]PHM78973.1 D-gluconate kinase [Xenorhabdus cabanillasii JM26]CDL79356.1 Thermoresistant gluconokinase [Xenorhabdus cabanillasii JM26]